MKSNPVRRRLAAASFLAGAVVLSAGAGCAKDPQPAPAPLDPLHVQWDTPCTKPAAADPAVVCVPAGDPRISGLKDLVTIQVRATGAKDEVERRFQLLPAIAGAKWRVLVDSPAESVCESQERSEAPPPCGPLATRFDTKDCGTASATCTLRPTPHDNPAYPGFPDPRSTSPAYFAPWPVYERAGGMPGDLDKLFFESMNEVFPPAPGPPGTDVLSPAARRQLDLLAWQEFLALNWPVDEVHGESRKDLARPGPAKAGVCPAWAGWRRRAEMMRGPDALPIPWGINPTTSPGAAVCESFLADSRIAMLSATGGPLGEDFPDLREAAPQPGDHTGGHILFDRNGLFVFYDVRINRRFYDHVLRNSLHHGKPGPDGRRVKFPPGQLWPPRFTGMLKASAANEGPIAIKFAWRQLTDCDDQERFLLARTAIAKIQQDAALQDMRTSSCTPALQPASEGLGKLSQGEKMHLSWLNKVGNLDLSSLSDKTMFSSAETFAGDPASAPVLCRPKCESGVCLLGLVAMHVAHKTSSNQKWNWSTFMHRGALESHGGVEPMFQATGCGNEGAQAPPNCNECTQGKCVTRICQAYRPAEATEQLNEEVAGILARADDVPLLKALSNYRLVGIQWVTVSGDPFPKDLLNPLMETFVTDPDKHDCFACHRHAARGDTMFFLEKLYPPEPPAPAGVPQAAP